MLPDLRSTYSGFFGFEASRPARRRIDRQELEVVPLDRNLAAVAASLAVVGRPLGLALADRCCLALGLSRQLPVLTADRVWLRLDLGITITAIR